MTTNRTSILVFFCFVFALSSLQANSIMSIFESGDTTPYVAKMSLEIPACYGLRGAIHIEDVQGGNPPYYFSLDGLNYTTNPILPNIEGGEHQLFVKDNIGAVSDTLITMPEPEPFEVELRASANPVRPNMPFTIEAIVSPVDAELHEISWRPPQLIDKHFQLEQILALEESANFRVKVTNIHGCTATANLRVDVDERVVFTPNAIAPNQDQNAFFTIFSGGAVVNIVSLQIFSRWGKPVFSKENFLPNEPLEGWNGRINNKAAIPGVYIYKALVEYTDGTQEQLTGDLSVMPSN